MNTTREQAIQMMEQAKASKDYELANICAEFVLWLDKKKAQA